MGTVYTIKFSRKFKENIAKVAHNPFLRFLVFGNSLMHNALSRPFLFRARLCKVV